MKEVAQPGGDLAVGGGWRRFTIEGMGVWCVWPNIAGMRMGVQHAKLDDPFVFQRCWPSLEHQHPPCPSWNADTRHATECRVRKGDERSGTRTWFREQSDGPFAWRQDGVCPVRPWRRRSGGGSARGGLGLPGNGPTRQRSGFLRDRTPHQISFPEAE